MFGTKYASFLEQIPLKYIYNCISNVDRVNFDYLHPQTLLSEKYTNWDSAGNNSNKFLARVKTTTNL